MILPDYLEKEVKKYCRFKKIPCKNGIVSSFYITEVKQFIEERLQKDRIVTRRQETLDQKIEKMHIKYCMKGMEPQISIEDYMKEALEKAGLYKYCKQQFPVGSKFIDFAFLEAKLALECDGHEYHHSEAWQIERDQKRDIYLARKGWRVLHIEGLAIRRNISLCIEKIEQVLEPFLTKQYIKEIGIMFNAPSIKDVMKGIK
jgi:very-short-patch-repair endonuclease